MAIRHHCHRAGKCRQSLTGALLIIALLAGPSGAQQSPLSTPMNSREPIQISADTMEADNRDRTFIFRGHVKVVQGETVITSERLKVWYRDEADSPSPSAPEGSARIRDIEAEGQVVILFDGRTARADKALYAAENETLTLTGENATIVDGKNTISGARITLYRAQDRITVESSRQGRVEAVFFPDGSGKRD